MYRSELLLQVTGCIPGITHSLYKFIVLILLLSVFILLLSILHRIYHWTYKHFWVFFLAIKKILGFYGCQLFHLRFLGIGDLS